MFFQGINNWEVPVILHIFSRNTWALQDHSWWCTGDIMIQCVKLGWVHIRHLPAQVFPVPLKQNVKKDTFKKSGKLIICSHFIPKKSLWGALWTFNTSVATLLIIFIEFWPLCYIAPVLLVFTSFIPIILHFSSLELLEGYISISLLKNI